MHKSKSEEHRAKIAAAVRSTESRSKASAKMRGRTHTPEAVEKIRAAKVGKKRPPWVIDKFVATRKANKNLNKKIMEAYVVVKEYNGLLYYFQNGTMISVVEK